VQNDPVDTVALADGDLRWVFPLGTMTPELIAVLEQANRRFLDIAAALDQGRAGWTGRGLEFWLLPSGQRKLAGFAESAQVTFIAELLPPVYFEPASSWEVTAEIAVRCDHEVDCGMHRIESTEELGLKTAQQAIQAFGDMTEWLLRRAMAVEPDEWRTRDPHRR
jgi:hypothetical protein